MSCNLLAVLAGSVLLFTLSPAGAADAPPAAPLPSTNRPAVEGEPNFTPPAAASTIVLPSVSLPEDKAFVHPGLLQSQANIDFIRQKLAAGAQPWTGALKSMLTTKPAQLNYQPKIVENVVTAPYGKPVIGPDGKPIPGGELVNDGNAAYTEALLWCLTGKKEYADKAISILNGWASTVKTISGAADQGKVLTGWAAAKYCNAAELLRYYRQPDGSTAGWAAADVESFKKMLQTIFYPLIKDFQPTFNGNWGTAMMDSTLCIAVFCDDHAEFNRAVDYYLHGEGNGALTHYIFDSGQCQETRRDQGHVQIGLGGMAALCEVAWKQGLDLYGMADNRLMHGYEYSADYNLGNDVPHVGNIGEKGRGKFIPIYELVYQHYVIDKGLEMPFTRQVLDRIRPESYNAGMAEIFGTLTCYRGPDFSLPPAPAKLK